MQIQSTWTTKTDHSQKNELKVGRTYWDSYDGQLFTALGIRPDQAKVVFHYSDSIEWVEWSKFSVDFDAIHPVKLIEADGA